MYRFTWPSPAFGGILGACHALELPFVWNNLRKTGASVLTGTDNPSDGVQALADGMQQAWIAFARTGDPGWSPYDTATRATMHFDITSGVQDDPEVDRTM
jgi:para-nitrobenzyl esterase